MGFVLQQIGSTAPRAAPFPALRAKAAIVLFATCVASCNDSSRTTTPANVRAGGKANPSAGIGATLPPSTVSFDVAIQASSSGAPTRTLSWHIDRARVGVNAWQTTVTVPDDPRLIHIRQAPWRPKRFVVDETGHLTIYRADGGLVALPDPSQEPIASLVAKANLPVLASARSRPATLRTDWLSRLVMTASGRVQEATAAKSGGSPLDRDASGLDHYAKSVGGNRVDFGIDPAAGLVTSLNVSGNSRTHQVAYQYLADAAGNSIRWRTQINDSAPALSRTTTIVLSNIIIDGHEVQP